MHRESLRWQKKMSAFLNFHEICSGRMQPRIHPYNAAHNVWYSGRLSPSSGKSSLVLASAKASSHKHLSQHTLSSSRTFRTIDAGSLSCSLTWHSRCSWSNTACSLSGTLVDTVHEILMPHVNFVTLVFIIFCEGTSLKHTQTMPCSMLKTPK